MLQPLLQGKGNKYDILCVCVFVDLGIHHAMHLHHIVICGLPASTVFLHIVSQMAKFSKTNVIEHKMYVFIFSTTFVCNISHSKKN